MNKYNAAFRDPAAAALVEKLSTLLDDTPPDIAVPVLGTAIMAMVEGGDEPIATIDALTEFMRQHIRMLHPQSTEGIEMDCNELSEYDQMQMVDESLLGLVDEGKVQMIGRLASGERVWDVTEPPSLGRRITQTLQRVMAIVGLVPALIMEYAVYLTASVIARVFNLWETAESLVRVGDGLRSWRQKASIPRRTVWLSIKY